MINERQKRWDERYVRLAQHVAQWSKDPSTKVGAVLVRPNNSAAATGFNGFPPGHDDLPELYEDREYKYAHVVHAEINALNFYCDGADRGPDGDGQPAAGFTLYTSFPVCPDCMMRLVEEGITRVVSPALPSKGKSEAWIAEWSQRALRSMQLASKGGIMLKILRGFANE